MKDLSFFLLKNTLGAKMRKGYSNFCNGDGSTSTLNQRKTDSAYHDSYLASPSVAAATTGEEPLPTLEEMILQLEFEEKMARNAKHDEYGEIRRRMSSVNNSDILRSARNALNQYPRFSLDGKDAMYRSSFRNLPPINPGVRKGFNKGGCDFKTSAEKKNKACLPPIFAGESVVWCEPGVVAKLMGLEAVPVPLRSNPSRKETFSSVINRQNLRRRAEKYEIERRKIVMGMIDRGEVKRGVMGSCSAAGYCVMKPIKVDRPAANDEAGWPIRRFQ